MKPSGICWHSLHAAGPGAAPACPLHLPPLSPAAAHAPPHTGAQSATCTRGGTPGRRVLHAQRHAPPPRRCALIVRGSVWLHSYFIPKQRGEAAKPGEQESILLWVVFFPTRPHKPQAGACLGITAQSKAQSPETAPFPSFLLLNTTVSM